MLRLNLHTQGLTIFVRASAIYPCYLVIRFICVKKRCECIIYLAEITGFHSIHSSFFIHLNLKSITGLRSNGNLSQN